MGAYARGVFLSGWVCFCPGKLSTVSSFWQCSWQTLIVAVCVWLYMREILQSFTFRFSVGTTMNIPQQQFVSASFFTGRQHRLLLEMPCISYGSMTVAFHAGISKLPLGEGDYRPLPQ